MAEFYVWETVDFSIKLTREDGSSGVLQNVDNVIISMEQGGLFIERDINSPDIALDVDKDTITMHFSQEDTGQFQPNKTIRLQINILYKDGERDTSAPIQLNALSNLHDEVMG